MELSDDEASPLSEVYVETPKSSCLRRSSFAHSTSASFGPYPPKSIFPVTPETLNSFIVTPPTDPSNKGRFPLCVTPTTSHAASFLPTPESLEKKVRFADEYVSPTILNVEILTPPMSSEKQVVVETPRSHRMCHELSALPRALKSKCRIDVDKCDQEPPNKSRKRLQNEQKYVSKKSKTCAHSRDPNLSLIKEEEEEEIDCSKRLQSETPSGRGFKRLYESCDDQKGLQLEMCSPKKKIKCSDGEEFRKNEVSPKKKLRLRISSTPKKLAETLWSDKSNSPMKIGGCPIGWNVTPGTPKKLLQALQKDKENSPIKIDGWNNMVPLVLKAPPVKLSSRSMLKESQYEDIITELMKRDMHLIIRKIFKLLSPFDLLNIPKVNLQWGNVYKTVVLDSKHFTKEKQALTSKENLYVVEKRNGTRLETTPLKQMGGSLVNRRSPRRVTPLSPELSPKTRRFGYFLKEGKRLGSSQTLARCPKCSYPARPNSGATLAMCSSCQYKFCPVCRFGQHVGDCNFTMGLLSPSPQKPAIIGSKKSKRTLQRLVLP